MILLLNIQGGGVILLLNIQGKGDSPFKYGDTSVPQNAPASPAPLRARTSFLQRPGMSCASATPDGTPAPRRYQLPPGMKEQMEKEELEKSRQV